MIIEHYAREDMFGRGVKGLFVRPDTDHCKRLLYEFGFRASPTEPSVWELRIA